MSFPIPSHLGEQTNTQLAATSFLRVGDSCKVTPESPFHHLWHSYCCKHMKLPESLANNDRNECLKNSSCLDVHILRTNCINAKTFPEWLWVGTFFPSYSYKRQWQAKAISMCSYFSLSTSVIWVLIAAQLPSFASCVFKAFERCCYSMVIGC